MNTRSRVPVVLETQRTTRRVEVRFDPERATARDLAQRLARALARVDVEDDPTTDAGELWIDGVAVPAASRLVEAGLVRGATLRLTASPPARTPSRPALELLVTGGVRAGRRQPLRRGSHILGREADVTLASPTVSRRHARLDVDDETVTVVDLDSRNGLVIDGARVTERRLADGMRCTAGAVEFTVAHPAPTRPVTATPTTRGTLVLHRPPRRRSAAPDACLSVPSAPASPGGAPAFGWAAVLAPLVLGAVMALVFDPRYAAFMAFSPLIAVGTWYEQRRRAKRDERAGAVSFEAAVDNFASELESARAQALEHRRVAYPHLAEITRRALAGSAELWERRPRHSDHLELVVGSGRVPWRVPLAGPGRTSERDEHGHDAIADLVRAASRLDDAPVTTVLRAGRVLGISGARDVGMAVARSLLCQAAVLHGPADLRILVVHDAGREADWRWTRWLPHGTGRDGVVRLGPDDLHDGRLDEVDGDLVVGWGTGDAERDEAGPTVLVVLDVADLSAPTWAPARALLDDGVAAIALGATPERLPSSTTTALDLHGSEGAARLQRLEEDGSGDEGATAVVEDLLVTGMDESTATTVARHLARFEDPEMPAGSALPARTRLLDVLELSPGEEAVRSRWAANSTAKRLAVAVGRTAEGPAVIDLVRDGPHGLVGGTTGSGKSELLRSLVVALAATYDASRVNFVLIDYKGGSAFDACAGLPHTAGVVTDLDEHLAARALRCLEAELRRRERELRTVGAADIVAYARDRLDESPPLPRLLVVVDEFAALASELPDFVDALVDVAQRGRSLGVHLLLATQRPSGAISDNIRANTNLRIALRMQDAADSTDVLGCADAAAIPGDRPGRALARIGSSGLVTFQTALCTQPARTVDEAVVDVVVDGAEGQDAPADAGDGADAGEESDLGVLVSAIRAAHERAGVTDPREPWPQPLPERLDLDDVDVPEHGVALGVADDPDRQRQRPYVWRPEHSMLLFGIPGSGTTTALCTAAVSLARRFDPQELHLYVLDFGSQELHGLTGLPHTGAVVGAHERERQQRLVRFLGQEVARRRTARHGDESGGRDPRVVLLLDNYPGFASAFDGVGDIAVRDELHRIVADGPDVGISVVLSADRLTGVPSSVASVVASKLLFRLPDRYDYTGLGVPADAVPPPLPGRAVDVETGQEVQIAMPGPEGLGDAVEAVAKHHDLTGVPAVSRPATVDVLPERVKTAELAPHVHVEGRVWRVPIGIADTTLAPVAVAVGPGEPLLVAGPARSGKSSALASIATLVKAPARSIDVIAVIPRTSPLREVPGINRVVSDPGDLGSALEDGDAHAQVVLVDDAHLVDDPDGLLSAIAAGRHEHVRLVAAGRTDALRAAYGHWTGEVRRSRRGIVLRPNLATDGDLWQVALPRRGPERFVAGRGYLVGDGRSELVQCACPDGLESPA